MARARNIKPSLFKNEILGVADPLLTLLFESLWMLADREGRLEDRPMRIKAETFPYREGLDINGYLTELQRLGFIVRYVVGEQAFIQVVNFKKHQTPHNTEKPSEIPPPEVGIVERRASPGGLVKSPLNNGEVTQALPPDSLLLIPDSLNLIPDTRISPTALSTPPEKPPGKVDLLPCPVEKIVDLFHECLPENPRCKVLNEQRRGLIRQRWREASSIKNRPFGYRTVEDGLKAWREFFQVCRDSDFLTGKAPPTTPGRPPFVATVDFLFSPSGFVKTLENRYHQESA